MPDKHLYQKKPSCVFTFSKRKNDSQKLGKGEGEKNLISREKGGSVTFPTSSLRNPNYLSSGFPAFSTQNACTY
jgi:hypothetical protein